MKTGDALQLHLQLTTPALQTTTAALWHPQGLAPRYTHYLPAMHGIVRASVPLMEHAATRLTQPGPPDPLREPLIQYLHQHIEEERGHDQWLLDDITALGGHPAAVLTTQPPPTIARLAGAQHYWIQYHHPVALLGYIAVLETHAPTPQLADHIAAAGIPHTALRAIREHAHLDTTHTTTLLTLLNTLPLNPQHTHAILISALHTIDGLLELFTRITQAAAPYDTTAAPRHHGLATSTRTRTTGKAHTP